jgi:hypothetical protein
MHPIEDSLAQDLDAPSPDEIRSQLRSILASPAFHGSHRCQQFLEYVCEKSLAGAAATLKERTVAIEVFGRQPQSDLGEDTIVRVGAREVHYVTPEGAASGILIDLPRGAYVPEFRYAGPHTVKGAPPAPRGRRWAPVAIWTGGFALVAFLGAFTALKWTAATPNAEAFSRFWEPVFRTPGPLLMAVAHPIVYHPSERATRMSEESQPPPETPAQRQVQLQARKLDGSDLVPVLNQYVGFGDMVAATRISSMLARKSKSVRVRLASSIAFDDLRKAQILLIGAVTNRWTMELQPAWRFQFSRAPGLRTVIVDTMAASSPAQWSIPNRADGSAQEDYILVCRIPEPIHGRLADGRGRTEAVRDRCGRRVADRPRPARRHPAHAARRMGIEEFADRPACQSDRQHTRAAGSCWARLVISVLS